MCPLDLHDAAHGGVGDGDLQGVAHVSTYAATGGCLRLTFACRRLIVRLDAAHRWPTDRGTVGLCKYLAHQLSSNRPVGRVRGAVSEKCYSTAPQLKLVKLLTW